jgi:thioester reductase-like protein
MEKEGLGLSKEDRQFLLSSHISVVFHIAASLALREPLAKCVKTNAMPVIELIGLCEEMPELKVNK